VFKVVSHQENDIDFLYKIAKLNSLIKTDYLQTLLIFWMHFSFKTKGLSVGLEMPKTPRDFFEASGYSPIDFETELSQIPKSLVVKLDFIENIVNEMNAYIMNAQRKNTLYTEKALSDLWYDFITPIIEISAESAIRDNDLGRSMSLELPAVLKYFRGVQSAT
jgi:hypothetical protein